MTTYRSFGHRLKNACFILWIILSAVNAVLFLVWEGYTRQRVALLCIFPIWFALYRLYRRWVHRCPECSQRGILYGWNTKPLYTRTDPPVEVHARLDEQYCTYDRFCPGCRTFFEVKLAETKSPVRHWYGAILPHTFL